MLDSTIVLFFFVISFKIKIKSKWTQTHGENQTVNWFVWLLEALYNIDS